MSVLLLRTFFKKRAKCAQVKQKMCWNFEHALILYNFSGSSTHFSHNFSGSSTHFSHNFSGSSTHFLHNFSASPKHFPHNFLHFFHKILHKILANFLQSFSASVSKFSALLTKTIQHIHTIRWLIFWYFQCNSALFRECLSKLEYISAYFLENFRQFFSPHEKFQRFI